MDVVDKARCVCQMCYLHGKIADMDTPISSATNSTTPPCQWNMTQTENPGRTLYIQCEQTKARGWQSSAKLDSSTLPLHSYPRCAVSPDLQVPELKVVLQVKGHKDRFSWCSTYHPSWLLAAFVTFRQTHTHNHASTLHTWRWPT